VEKRNKGYELACPVSARFIVWECVSEVLSSISETPFYSVKKERS
jgi:hypothetical protein